MNIAKLLTLIEDDFRELERRVAEMERGGKAQAGWHQSPLETGYYWYRFPGLAADICWIDKGMMSDGIAGGMFGSMYNAHVKSGMEFQGPIKSPTKIVDA